VSNPIQQFLDIYFTTSLQKCLQFSPHYLMSECSCSWCIVSVFGIPMCCLWLSCNTCWCCLLDYE